MFTTLPFYCEICHRLIYYIAVNINVHVLVRSRPVLGYSILIRIRN